MDTGLSPQTLQFIQANFPVLPVPSVPEISLHKAVPKSGLWRLAEMDAHGFGEPYWAHYWGGGLALARHILDHPETVAGRGVLDLGTGSGIVGIAAAKAGAGHVICADTDRYATAVARLNAVTNGVGIATFLGDMTANPPPTVDIVLVGDLFYERDLAARVTTFLDRCLGAHIEVLIGDPWRAFLPHSRLRLVAEYPGLDFGQGAQARERQNAVFSFRETVHRDKPCLGKSPKRSLRMLLCAWRALHCYSPCSMIPMRWNVSSMRF
ncbi:methyltransferase [Phyllobacterium phragmitis]|uniref:Methyltransferase n=1 Tax=Phyllobacterium phragmitis TaxID=2670329 RepID=A0A2S9IMH9_9HYPH|nr:methyltransferase [Phyllobacterium phragmitis]